jgi:phosphoglycerate dehydrogenase-like enzyme
VFEQEPLPPEHPFWLMKNVVVTAHLGGFYDAYVDRAMPTIVHNMACFLAGRTKDMINLVPRQSEIPRLGSPPVATQGNRIRDFPPPSSGR